MGAPQKTAAKKYEIFLAALAKECNITHACKLSKLDRSNVYKKRKKSPKFAAAWDEALERGVERLELEARRRALHGTKKPVFHKGAVCGHIREYSDTLAIFLLKAHKPDKYRERSEVKHTGGVSISINTNADAK